MEAPEATGGALFASRDGGTGGPMNAGFAALIAAGLGEGVAATAGMPGLDPAFASPVAGAVNGVPGAGVRDG